MYRNSVETTLSLKLFAKFQVASLERKALVDAFLTKVLVNAPDIAVRDRRST
jgi:glycyl-tRNA synthetase beta subunit